MDSALEECVPSATLQTEFGEVKKEANSVIEKAKSRICELNTSIRLWEQFEALRAKFKEWHDNVEAILSSRVSDDITALDVPDEYKQLQAEFDHYEREIGHWKKVTEDKSLMISASNCFQLQLDHISRLFGMLILKFNTYKQPIGLESKVERITREINNINDSLKELSSLSMDSCSSALDHANQITLQIKKAKVDLQELETLKNTLLKDRMVTEDFAQELTRKIKQFCQEMETAEEKSSTMLKHLKISVQYVQSLEEHLEAVDKAIGDVELKLSLSTRSDGSENTGLDQSCFDSFNEELNRQESFLVLAERDAKKLREEGISFNEEMIEQRWKRIRRIQGELHSWIDPVKGMADDKVSSLAQLDAAFTHFLKALDVAEKKENIQDLNNELNKNRTEKSLLLEKYRRLIKENPDAELKFNLLLCQIEERWNFLEKRCYEALPVLSPTPPRSFPSISVDGSFQEKIISLHKIFTFAKNYIDFTKYPVTSVFDWDERIQTVNNWLINFGDDMKGVLEEGRRMASLGRMELDVHDALESLDNVVDLANEVEISIKSNNALLLPLQTKAETLAREIRLMREVLDKLAARDLSEPAIASATQHDLLDRQSQLEQLHRKSEELHDCLPGASSGFPDKKIVNIYTQVRQIEEKIGAAMKKKALEKDARSGYASSGPSFDDRSVGPDTVSVSSAGGPSLALEVQETDDEKTKHDVNHDNFSSVQDMEINSSEFLHTVITEMSKMEECLSAGDPFPFEKLTEKVETLKALRLTLDEIEQKVNGAELNMEEKDADVAKEKIFALRSALSTKQEEVDDMIKSWEEVEKNLKTSRDMLDKINIILSGFEERNKSPDLNDLESLTVEPIIAQLGERQAAVIEDKLRKLGEDWKYCEAKVIEKRHSLDERLADRSELINAIELLEFWCVETETECSAVVNPLDSFGATELAAKISDRMSEYDEKLGSLLKIEALKERFVSSNLADPTVKERMQSSVSDLEKRVKNLKAIMETKKVALENIIKETNVFRDDIAAVFKFCKRAERTAEIDEDTNRTVSTGVDLKYVSLKRNEIEGLVKSIEKRWKAASSCEALLDEKQNEEVNEVIKKWGEIKERMESVTNAPALTQGSSISIGDEALSESRVSALSTSETNNEIRLIEYPYPKESFAEDDELDQQITSEKEQALLNTLVQFGHWLAESERDASAPVDIINLQSIREAAHTVQSFIDQMNIRYKELFRILNNSENHVIREKAELTIKEWDRNANECKRRKAVLNEMMNESRAWEKLRLFVQNWLTDSQKKLDEGIKANDLNEEGLKSELEELKEMDKNFNEMKEKMVELNNRSNILLDVYKFDERHNLSHATSRINNLWSKFNDNLRNRRAVLEAALRSRNDFHSALLQLEQWMAKIYADITQLDESTCNLQLLKDSLKRKDWIDTERYFQLEMDAHEDLVNSVAEMGTQMVRDMDNSSEREHLIERLESVKQNWEGMKKVDDKIRQRLTDAQKEWEILISQLSENLYWIETKAKELHNEQPVGKSLGWVQKQDEFNLEQELEKRQRDIDDCITLAHSYLMQHDLRPKMHTTNTLTDTTQVLGEEEAELRRIGLQINADCEDMSKKWSELRKMTQDWLRVVNEAHQKMEQLSNAIAECQLALSDLESTMEKLTPVENLRLEQLVDAMKSSEALKGTLVRARIHVDDANDCCGQLLAANIDLDTGTTDLLKSVNDRFAKLKVDIRVRTAALEHALADFGPCSQHFLMSSVKPPWQRAISAVNHLPYYINHETEITQWDHPAMVEILSQLSKFNQVKFSAYRTAMKMRAIQKRLCLDLLSLQELDTQLNSLSGASNDRLLPIKDAIMCLVPLYESAHNKFPQLVRSVPLAVDLFLNFVLDVFDSGRDGVLRIFSFKLVLVLLCNANLEDKYRYLYQLVSSGGGMDQKSLALLLYDAIHIPKFFGEAAAFGGSNIEPSVRSCFETVKFSRTIGIDDFLLWLKKEPQTVVWLPVMHRLASAEFAKHQAKCNVCKMYPITGLRYRCLKCFNFDMCQNCFFSQRIAKNHKLNHPMQEYCVPTTSGEDVRDFGIIVKNKFHLSSKTRIGYLPVQTVDEGVPLETKNIVPTNPLTEHLHNRIQICSQRLSRARGDASPVLPDVEDGNNVDIKSPLQLVSQVEQMHKEELHQVLHKLQSDNRELKKEIERRRNFEGVGSTPNLTHSLSRNGTNSIATGRSVPSLSHSTDEHLMREARLLRQHKERLEERSRILEEQNKQLEVQLERLRTVLSKQQNVNVESVTPTQQEICSFSGEEDEGIEYDARPNRMPSLIASVDQLGRAMQSLVTSMVNDDGNGEITPVKDELKSDD
uniref:Nesprin-1 n=1 Tax=Syphacia muris TaxID=451379 RepID=A0A0N5ALC9_9BILA